jgi:hypothetical protein
MPLRIAAGDEAAAERMRWTWASIDDCWRVETAGVTKSIGSCFFAEVRSFVALGELAPVNNVFNMPGECLGAVVGLAQTRLS